MKTGELCNREVITASRDTSIAEAARLMRDHHVGSLIIVESRDGRTEPVGILTDRDIVIEVIAEDVAVTDVTIGDVMSFALLKVSADESVLETTQRMRARGVRRAPVSPVVLQQPRSAGAAVLGDRGPGGAGSGRDRADASQE